MARLTTPDRASVPGRVVGSRRALAVAALALSIFATSYGPTGPIVDRYGAGGGAVCGTDGQCAAYAADHPT